MGASEHSLHPFFSNFSCKIPANHIYYRKARQKACNAGGYATLRKEVVVMGHYILKIFNLTFVMLVAFTIKVK